MVVGKGMWGGDCGERDVGRGLWGKGCGEGTMWRGISGETLGRRKLGEDCVEGGCREGKRRREGRE